MNFKLTSLAIAFLMGMMGCWLSACQQGKSSSMSKDALARAGDRELYPSDLEGLVPEGTNPVDSAEIVRQFTQNWLREEVMLSKADQFLGKEEQALEKELQWYKRQLVLRKIEEKLKSDTDTTYTQAELDSFFTSNPSLFSLSEPVFKGRLILLPAAAPRLDWAEKVIRTRNKKELEQLTDYCLRFAKHTHLNDSTWFSAESVFKNMSDQLKSRLTALAPGQLIRQTEGNTLVLVWVAGYRKAGETAPYEYAQWNTRKLLLLHKQNQHLLNTQEALYQKALKNKSIETIHP